MRIKSNKIFAVLLAIIMAMSALPFGVLTTFAQNENIIRNDDNKQNAEWDGKGTAESPFLLKTSEDLKALSGTTNNDGKSYSNTYFRFENDITLPDDWTPIGTSKNKFSGIIDGNDKTLTVPAGSLSLIGSPNSSTVKNMKLYGEKIPGYGLVQGYTVSCTINIENVTILKGSHILYSGFIGGYGNSSIIIRNCTVQKGVFIGDDGSGFWGDLGNTEFTYPFVGKFNHRDNVGSFAGAFNGKIMGCVSYATVYGRNNVGGIVGMKGQSMREMNINNCEFHGDIVADGNASGGIVGNGYATASTSNSPCVTIQNCLSSGNISGSNYVGGIFGGELGVTQCWANGIGYIQNNLFTGTLHASEPNAYVGGIIGYMRSLDRYNIIENNYYSEKSAKLGIGAVPLVDTNCETADKTDEAVTYVSTRSYARSDDPLGADAQKLTKSASEKALSNGTIKDLLNNGENSLKNWVDGAEYPIHSKEPVAYKMTLSGEFKTSYYIGEKLDFSGLSIKVDWSDGSVTYPNLGELKITGYDASKRGVQEITLSIGAAEAKITVTVLKPVGADITVTVSMFGDHVHAEGETDVHTMASGNLAEWVAETKYTLSNNATVWDLMQRVFKDNNMTCSNPSGNYISSVTRNGEELAEVTNGANSGWMYTLNGSYPILGVSEQYLDDDDIIVFHYTDDYILEKAFEEAKKTAYEVVEMINAIGNVTLASVDAISTAREAYDALTDNQQALVSNYAVLLEAEKAYASLIKTNEEFEKIYDLVGKYIASLGTPDVGSIGGEWAVIGLARSGKTVSDEYRNQYYSNVVKYVNEHINDKGQIHRAKSTDNSRIILALTALGYDAANVGGHNLLSGLTAMDYVKKQGINGPIWALIAFDAHSYAIPENADKAQQVTREGLIGAILDAQLSDGGWSLSEDNADADMTAMAIQALAKYYGKNEVVKAAVDKALNRLSAMQTSTGGYLSWSSVNSESCAQVIVALTALGIDPMKDSRFIKNGCSVVDSLLSFYAGGGFSHTANGNISGMATEQGYYALASYARMKDGKTSLYDMSDVKLKVGEIVTPPDESTQPDDTTKPSDTTKPGNTVKPSDTAKPSNDTKPSDTTKPSNDIKPNDTTKPGDTIKPNDTTKPIKPSDVTKPSHTVKPNDVTNPSDITKPSDTNNTSNTASDADKNNEIKNPHTGDSFNAAICIGFMMLAFAMFTVALAAKRKEKQN